MHAEDSTATANTATTAAGTFTAAFTAATPSVSSRANGSSRFTKRGTYELLRIVPHLWNAAAHARSRRLRQVPTVRLHGTPNRARLNQPRDAARKGPDSRVRKGTRAGCARR